MSDFSRIHLEVIYEKSALKIFAQFMCVQKSDFNLFNPFYCVSKTKTVELHLFP